MTIDNLVNINLERQCLASLLEYPDLYFDIELYSGVQDYESPIHKACFTLIKEARLKKESIDVTVLSQRLITLGISKFEELPIFDYIDSFRYNKFQNIATSKTGFRELSKLHTLRKIYSSAQEISKYIVSNANEDLEKIVINSDQIYNKISNIAITSKQDPIDLYDNFQTYLDSLGADTRRDGIQCPYPIFRDLYGDFYPKSLNFIVARAKVGKSSILENIAWEAVSNPKQKVKALILDTEMDEQMQRNRRLANLSGVNEWFIRTGKFKKNQKMFEAVCNAAKLLGKYSGLISYMPIGGADINYVSSIITRWVRKNYRDDTQLFVVYDYIKLSTELGNKSYERYKDYQIVTQKVDILKQLANNLDIPILTAGQTNRTNEERVSKDKKIRDGKTVGLSDGINQLSDKVLILDRLTTEEMAELQDKYKVSASHSLQSLYCRSLGRYGAEREMVRVLDSHHGSISYYENRIFFRVQNFKMQEIASLWDLEQMRQKNIDITSNSGNINNIML